MKERKREIKTGLAIVWTVCSIWAVCFLFGVAYWSLIGWGNWPMTWAPVGIGIFASVIFLRKEMAKESRVIIWIWCVALCLVAVFATGTGNFFSTVYKMAQIQVRTENMMAEYMGSRGSYIENTEGVIRTDDAYARFGIWKTEKGQITLLLVKITGEDIGPVREVPIPME